MSFAIKGLKIHRQYEDLIGVAVSDKLYNMMNECVFLACHNSRTVKWVLKTKNSPIFHWKNSNRPLANEI